jgi:hypothetical protein
MTEPTEHGVESAYYNNLPTQHPVLECLCGWSTDSREEKDKRNG